MLYRNQVESTLTIEGRFCGPPATANGGYLSVSSVWRPASTGAREDLRGAVDP